ncbi:TPA: EAL domain-containing protein [Klebsiella quasipneumoniae subsp. similipneumoniae]|nr:EAL domain-containing protein [Klebsiella quasipneumoniae subsp. similipneumoniae]
MFKKISNHLAAQFKSIAVIIKNVMLNVFSEKHVFVPFVQPLFSAKSDCLIGCEVLLRIKTQHGYDSPIMIINDLEQSNKMNGISIELMQYVSDFYLHHKDKFPDDFHFSFNVFINQLSSAELVDSIILFKKKVDHHAQVHIEIVERCFTPPTDLVINNINVLISHGVLFALDDFGTNSGAFKYIENIAFSVIKIDKEITAVSEGRLAYPNLIDAIIMMSKKLGLTVIAEGVESEEQKKLLTLAGVDVLQGFVLAKPVSVDEFYKKYLLKY